MSEKKFNIAIKFAEDATGGSYSDTETKYDTEFGPKTVRGIATMIRNGMSQIPSGKPGRLGDLKISDNRIEE